MTRLTLRQAQHAASLMFAKGLAAVAILAEGKPAVELPDGRILRYREETRDEYAKLIGVPTGTADPTAGIRR